MYGMSNRTKLVVLGLALVALAASGCADQEPRYHALVPQKSATETATLPRPPGRVLFVLSAAQLQILQNGKRRPTGNFLSELYEPYAALTNAGYQVVAATPGGRPPSIDPESLADKYWGDHLERRDSARSLLKSPPFARPMPLGDALAVQHEFQGLVVPGGQGLMVDLLHDADAHALVAHFAASDRPLGMICHAPALLTRLATPSRLRGRQLTSVSGFEEFYIETFVMGGDARVRNIGEQLENAGYAHDTAFAGRSHAVRDCNLVTSQNPFSGADFTRLYLAALGDSRRGARCVAASE